MLQCYIFAYMKEFHFKNFKNKIYFYHELGVNHINGLQLNEIILVNGIGYKVVYYSVVSHQKRCYYLIKNPT